MLFLAEREIANICFWESCVCNKIWHWQLRRTREAWGEKQEVHLFSVNVAKDKFSPLSSTIYFLFSKFRSLSSKIYFLFRKFSSVNVNDTFWPKSKISPRLNFGLQYLFFSQNIFHIRCQKCEPVLVVFVWNYWSRDNGYGLLYIFISICIYLEPLVKRRKRYDGYS